MEREQTTIRLPAELKEKLQQEADSQKQNTQVEIFVKKHNSGYYWAWKESADKKVFGGASTISEIKRRAARLFPNSEIILSFL